MPTWTPRSITGLLLAAVYVLVAVTVIAQERVQAPGGHAISLKGIGAFIATLPVSATAELLGIRLDHRSNLAMGIAVGLCALLVYRVGARIAAAMRVLVRGGT